MTSQPHDKRIKLSHFGNPNYSGNTGKLTEARALPPPHIFRRNLKRYVRADGSELFNFVRRYRTRR